MDKTSNLPLKYRGYAIVCQEVPDEISLAFNISGCPHKCEQCHSQYLWEYEGNFIGEDLDKVLSVNKEFISCVCFMGGDQNMQELYNLCKHIKDDYNLKTCVYSGLNDIAFFTDLIKDNLLDYLKLGKYDYKKGGLSSMTTNQVMYKIVNNKIQDVSYRFRTKYNFT